MAAMLHVRNNTILFLWDKVFILMQNIFIVPAMQHGRQAKPLLKLCQSLFMTDLINVKCHYCREMRGFNFLWPKIKLLNANEGRFILVSINKALTNLEYFKV